MKLRVIAVGLLILALLAAPASAHFLWINTTKSDAGKVVAQLCFSEEAAPGEADLADKVAAGTLWTHKPGQKPEALKLVKKIDGDYGSYDGELADPAVGLTAALDYGVITRNEKTFLLQYYAKRLDIARRDELKNFGRSENLRLDIVPSMNDGECELLVLFDGKPAPAGSQVMVSPPGGKQAELKVDGQGKVNFKLVATPGKYEIRARVQHDKPGQRDGKAYTHEMHYATLALVTTSAK